MVIKKPETVAQGPAPDRSPLSQRFLVGWSALLLTCMTGANALGQVVADPETPGGPIEDTWRYLVEMFRLLLGL